MGLFQALKDGTHELFIARPEIARGLLVSKHKDATIPNHATVTVEADEVALFFRKGTSPVVLPPGQHVLETSSVPYLKHLVNLATEGNVFRAELYFVTMREIPDQKFGGPIGNVVDADTGEGVDLMVHGSFSIQVADPTPFVIGLSGLRGADSSSVSGWLRELVMKRAMPAIGGLIAKKDWPLSKVTSGAYADEVSDEVARRANDEFASFGLKLVRMGAIHIDMDPADKERLNSLRHERAEDVRDVSKDAMRVKLAGGSMAGFQQYAQAKMVMATGDGLAKGGGSNALAGAGIGVGFGMAQAMAQQVAGSMPAPASAAVPAPAVAAPSGAPAAVACPSCKATVSAGKFCAECGAALPAVKRFCAQCGGELAATAKFCAGCGTRA